MSRIISCSGVSLKSIGKPKIRNPNIEIRNKLKLEFGK